MSEDRLKTMLQASVGPDRPDHYTHREHPAFGQIARIVNDIRLNYGDGQGLLGIVANRILDEVLKYPPAGTSTYRVERSGKNPDGSERWLNSEEYYDDEEEAREAMETAESANPSVHWRVVRVVEQVVASV